MFLRKATNKKTGRTYLSIVHNYRDKETKQSRTTVIKSIGYLDELEKEYDDPISFFTEEAKRLDAERRSANSKYTVDFSKGECLEVGTDEIKNFGYVALSKIYHELGLHNFFVNRQRHSKEKYDANSIMKMLIYSRIISPASKKKSYEMKNRFFEKGNYSLDDVYRSLSFFHKHKEAVQLWLNKRVKESYSRDSTMVYYDVTNYYFESDKIDELKRKGVSKEHKPNPIVQMGLFIDNMGLPITYELFAGNTNDCLTYRPNLKRLKLEYDLGKIIVVADKGMNTADNIWYTLSTKNGYVFSQSVRKASADLKNFVLDKSGYVLVGGNYKRKSRLLPRTIQITGTSGKKIPRKIDEKQIVFYSEKYAKRTRAQRANTIAKTMDLINNPAQYSSATSYGAAKYIKNIKFDKSTGEILTPSQALLLDEEKIREEEALDGYYVIVTSECDMPDEKIIDIYHGLWKIEESFKITKSDLEARPVYLSTNDHIEGHFLTCFISLLIARILEMKTEYKYGIPELLESLSKCQCIHLKENLYLFSYYDEILKHIGEKLEIDFSKKTRTLQEIKKILGSTKL